MDYLKQKLKEYGLKVDELEKELKESRKKRVYGIYIKSHTDIPDFEREVEAENVVEALKILQSNWLRDWNYVDILEHIDFPLHELDDVDRVVLALINEIKELRQRNFDLSYDLQTLKKKIKELLEQS
jgi:hypothetical protein